MNDFTLKHANQAAAGILPTVAIPDKNGSRSRAVIQAKPAAETLKTLAAMHVRKHGRMRAASLPQVAFAVDAKLLAHPTSVAANLRPALRTPSGAVSTGHRSRALDPEALMTGAILGQFIVENDAGRTRIAKAIVGQVRSAKARNGMDGLLLSALLHLEHVNDAGRVEALAAWRDTAVTAGSPDRGDSGVVVDGLGNTIGSVGQPVFADPFKDGLARPAVVNHLAELRGGDVMIGNFALAAGVILVGAAKGAYAGYKTGGLEGAVRGGFEGAGTAAFGLAKDIGGLIGAAFDALVGWVTSENDDAKQAEHEAKDVGKDVVDTPSKDIDNKPQKDAPEPPKDEGGGDPVGPDPEPEVPPPSSGFPAPDDGGGNPWSLIGYGPIVTTRDIQAMTTRGAAGAVAFARIAGLDSLRIGFATTQPALAQAHQLTDTTFKLDPSRIAALDLSARSFDKALSQIAPKISTLSAGR